MPPPHQRNTFTQKKNALIWSIKMNKKRYASVTAFLFLLVVWYSLASYKWTMTSITQNSQEIKSTHEPPVADNSHDDDATEGEVDVFEAARDKLLFCIVDAIMEDENITEARGISVAVNLCAKKFLKIDHDKHIKTKTGLHFLNYAATLKKFRKRKCSFLTIGIGGDVETEKEIAAMFKGCTMVGLDTGSDFETLYSAVGWFKSAQLGDPNATEDSDKTSQESATIPLIGPRLLRTEAAESLKQKSLSDEAFHFHFATLQQTTGEKENAVSGAEAFWSDEDPLLVCQLSAEVEAIAYMSTSQTWFLDFIDHSQLIPLLALMPEEVRTVDASGNVTVTNHDRVLLVSPDHECQGLFNLKHLINVPEVLKEESDDLDLDAEDEEEDETEDEDGGNAEQEMAGKDPKT